MHYFSVYVGVKDIPPDRVEDYLKKVQAHFLKGARADERFFFISNRHSDLCHFVKLDAPSRGDQAQKVLLESDRKGKNA